MKVGDNLTIHEITDQEWILVNDNGTKYYMPIEGGNTSKASELAGIICDIGAGDDEYARTVLPLIERLLADDYSQCGLFEEIDACLLKAEGTDEGGSGLIPNPNIMPVCGHEYSPEAKCGLPAGHANPVKGNIGKSFTLSNTKVSTVYDEITRLLFGKEK